MERKSAAFELKASDADGMFEGYASVFGDLDSYQDIVEPGAFKKSLKGRKPKMLWQHDTREIIGKWTEVREDATGLFVRGQLFTELARGKEALTLLREGELDSMSIGYRTVDFEMDKSVRKLKQVDLYEVSLVTFPALESALVTDVKSITTERDFERFLRDAGFSRKEATAIALHGFKAKDEQRDAVADEAESEALADLLNLLRQLQENTNAGD